MPSPVELTWSLQTFSDSSNEQQLLQKLCDGWEYWNYEVTKKFLSQNQNKLYYLSSPTLPIWAGLAIVQIGPFQTDLIYIFTHPDLRGQGHASHLLKQLINILSKIESQEELFLEVRESNSSAISLYNKLGMTLISCRKNYYKNGENALIYTKRLL